MATLLSDDSMIAVANAIRRHAPISRIDIARLLDMSPATVGRIIEQLITRQAVRETGPTHRRQAGRPSVALEFCADYGSVLSIDLRLTRAYAVLTDLMGNGLAYATKQLITQDTEQSIAQLLSLIDQLKPTHTDHPALKAIVVGAPSTVDVATGRVEWAQSLGWRDLPLEDILNDAFQIPVLIENDVNLAALGEYWKGVGRSGASDMVFVSVGTGIGAGIIQGGRLYRGASYAAGEVAYFITDPEALHENSSEVGVLENQIGYAGLLALAKQTADANPSSELAQAIGRSGSAFQSGEIFDLAASGDEAAQHVLRTVVDNLTVAVAGISVVLDPEVVVLGGPSHWNWNLLIEAIIQRVGSSLLRPLNLKASLLGDDVLITGGAYAALALEGVLRN